jgi:hypothetical protein
MSHLSVEALVDLADGTRAESSAPHLASCAACRAELTGLRAMMAAAADAEADAPEPSPLFWDQFSRHVREAVAAEAGAEPTPSHAIASRWRAIRASIVAAPGVHARARAFQAGAAIVVLIVAVAIPRILAPRTAPAPPTTPSRATDAIGATDVAPDAPRDDASLTFVADLAATFDADAARDAGLGAVSPYEALMHLNEGELRELERLLQAQMRDQGD